MALKCAPFFRLSLYRKELHFKVPRGHECEVMASIRSSLIFEGNCQALNVAGIFTVVVVFLCVQNFCDIVSTKVKEKEALTLLQKFYTNSACYHNKFFSSLENSYVQ